MYTINITFNIDPDSELKWLKYAKTEFIPNILDDGFGNIKMHRLLSAQCEMPTFAVQFTHNDLAFIQNWEKGTWEEYQTDIRTIFGEKVLFFKSLLEEI